MGTWLSATGPLNVDSPFPGVKVPTAPLVWNHFGSHDFKRRIINNLRNLDSLPLGRAIDIRTGPDITNNVLETLVMNSDKQQETSRRKWWRPGYNSVQNLLVLIRDRTSREHVYLPLPMTYNALTINYFLEIEQKGKEKRLLWPIFLYPPILYYYFHSPINQYCPIL